jgi:hypothetical protein
MVDIAFSPGVKILTWSPKDKGIITAVIEKGRDRLSLSPGLVFLAPVGNIKNQASPRENRFGITVGPEEKITVTYNRKTGYSLDIPACALLDYQGVLKNEHEMFWEIYPPMPTDDTEITGKEMFAVFSLIVQVPKNTPLTIDVLIEGRVKGDLWGVIPLKGSAVF